jgi:hypothetical protein
MGKVDSNKIIKLVGFNVKVGDKIRLMDMPCDPCPIPPGSIGVVTNIVNWGENEIQEQVAWRIKRNLNLICPPTNLR